MKRRANVLPITIISVLLVLLCFSLALLGYSSAWFTSGSNRKIQLVVTVDNLNFNLYQVDKSNNETLINLLEDNATFIDINDSEGSREILPDTEYSLKLVLKNEDNGSEEFKVRFKVTLYASDTNEDKLLDSDIMGFSSPSSTKGGFVLDSTDGYYYYRDNSGNVTAYDKTSNSNIMTSFKINYNETFANLNCENIKMVVDIKVY